MRFLDWLNALIKKHNLAPIPVPPKPAPPPAGRADFHDQVVDAMNRYRASVGKPGVFSRDPLLDAFSQSRADDMASRGPDGVLSHLGWDGIQAVYPNTAAAENVGEGFPTADELVAAWFNEVPPFDGHREAILGGLLRVGVGSARSKSGNLYWAVDFDER